MNTPQPLSQALQALRDDLQAREPPPVVWSGLAAEFQRRHVPSRPPLPLWRRPLAWSGAAACAVVLAGSALLMLRPAPLHDAVWAAQPDSRFVPLQPPESWAEGPAWVVDAELSAARLAALGLPYDPAHAGDRVRAELLLRASGEVLAVRLVQ